MTGLRIKRAVAAEEIVTVARLRHRVFVMDRGRPALPGGAVVDVFDALPAHANLLALRHGTAVATMRVCAEGPAGLPADPAYAFRDHLPPTASLACCDMLCVPRDVPDAPELIGGLVRTCVLWARGSGMSHLCVLGTDVMQEVLQQAGFVALEGFVSSGAFDVADQRCVPHQLDLSAWVEDLGEVVGQRHIGLWLQSLERAFYGAGECIVGEGEPGDEAFLVVRGRAEAVAHGSGDSGPAVARFEAGDVFGELALLTNRPRSTTVVARRPTEVMVIRRDLFHHLLESDVDVAKRLMRSMGDRFHDTITGRVP
ncbi:MAG: cyclic nucleotide-binding domain-containing protein [Myxococcales bacterium]|nr:cyclic nucleotide-binding domain-containing protein [Myxococcales bacterium]